MFDWLKSYKSSKEWRSPNFDERGEQKPHILLVHYTGMKTADAALKRLCNPAAKVSAHYLIEEQGKIHKLVDEDRRAWHAGISHWQGITDINAASIGIELVNPGHEFGYRIFPDRQLRALIDLCQRLIGKYGIKPHDILAHSDVAPQRKADPGELFDWRGMAAQGIGLWPDPSAMDLQAAEDIVLDDDAVLELLGSYGYDTEAGLKPVLTAFHRHFYPEKFIGYRGVDSKVNGADILSVARLLSLIRQRSDPQ